MIKKTRLTTLVKRKIKFTTDLQKEGWLKYLKFLMTTKETNEMKQRKEIKKMHNNLNKDKKKIIQG